MLPNLELEYASGNVHGAGHVTSGVFVRLAHIDDEGLAGTVHNLPIVFHPDRFDVLLRSVNFLHDGRRKGFREGSSRERQQDRGASEQSEDGQTMHGVILFMVRTR